MLPEIPEKRYNLRRQCHHPIIKCSLAKYQKLCLSKSVSLWKNFNNHLKTNTDFDTFKPEISKSGCFFFLLWYRFIILNAEIPWLILFVFGTLIIGQVLVATMFHCHVWLPGATRDVCYAYDIQTPVLCHALFSIIIKMLNKINWSSGCGHYDYIDKRYLQCWCVCTNVVIYVAFSGKKVPQSQSYLYNLRWENLR